jgi:hypothetical protein
MSLRKFGDALIFRKAKYGVLKIPMFFAEKHCITKTTETTSWCLSVENIQSLFPHGNGESRALPRTTSNNEFGVKESLAGSY